MKKVIALLLCLCALLSLAACKAEQPQTGSTNPTTAPTQGSQDGSVTPVGSILKGTPTVDAVIDDIYLSSYCVTVDHTMAFKIPVASPDEIEAKAYFLHDGEYIYVAAVVTGDSAVVDTKLVSWVADSVEIWFSNPAGFSSKITMDAFATPWPHNATNDRENKLKIDMNQVEMAAVRTEGGYTVEMKVKIPYYQKSEGTVAINVQLNNTYQADTDLTNFETRNGGCYGTQATKHAPIILTLSSETAQ